MVVRVCDLFCKLYKNIVFLIGLFILILLLAISFNSSCYLIAHYSEITFFVGDKLLINILIVVVFIGFILILRKIRFLSNFKITIENNNKVFQIIKWTILSLILSLTIAWVLLAKLSPNADALSVQIAVDNFSKGNIDDFILYGYISRHINQLGLFLISYLISVFAGTNNYVVLGVINCFGIMLIYKLLSDIGKLLGMNRFQQLLVLICGLFFVPLLLYSTFIYGTIMGFMFVLLSFKYEIKYLNQNKFYYAFISFISMTVAVLYKSNNLIALIAAIIYFLIKIINEREKYGRFIIVFLFIVSFFISSVLPTKIMEIVTGQNLNVSLPNSSYIAMGLQESDKAPGWHNGYNQDVYYGNEANIQKIKEADAKKINERLSHFLEHKGYAYKFFVQKIASQWNNASFQSLWVNQAQYTSIETHKVVLDILSVSNTHIITKLLKPFVLLNYIGTLFYIVLNKKGDNFVDVSLLFIFFIGNFIFLTFWEAKAQYTVTSFVILFPISILGYSTFLDSNLKTLKTKMLIPVSIILLSIFTINKTWSLEFLSEDTEEYNTYLLWPNAIFEKYK